MLSVWEVEVITTDWLVLFLTFFFTFFTVFLMIFMGIFLAIREVEVITTDRAVLAFAILMISGLMSVWEVIVHLITIPRLRLVIVALRCLRSMSELVCEVIARPGRRLGVFSLTVRLTSPAHAEIPVHWRVTVTVGGRRLGVFRRWVLVLVGRVLVLRHRVMRIVMVRRGGFSGWMALVWLARLLLVSMLILRRVSTFMGCVWLSRLNLVSMLICRRVPAFMGCVWLARLTLVRLMFEEGLSIHEMIHIMEHGAM